MSFRSRFAPIQSASKFGVGLSRTLVCGLLLSGCSSTEPGTDDTTDETSSDETTTGATTTVSGSTNTSGGKTSTSGSTAATTSGLTTSENEEQTTGESATSGIDPQTSNTATSDEPTTSEADESSNEAPDETDSPDGGGETSTEGEPTSSGETDSGETTDVNLEPFSFFVTSYKAIVEVSGSADGFGGDLRYGEPTGLEGADKICNEIAEMSMPGSSAKQWRAFLSVANGPDGEQVDAIDRIGEGPWYDRLGRLVGMTLEDLAQTRPRGADEQIINDLPNEDGVGNHAPDGTQIDNHHTLTGSNEEGRLYGPNATCADWTSTEKSADGRPRIGFSWPAGGREHWISGQDEGGCLPGIDLDGGGGGDPNVGTVGSGGGYGQFYCFALTP
jgi:hypothetical protein